MVSAWGARAVRGATGRVSIGDARALMWVPWMAESSLRVRELHRGEEQATNEVGGGQLSDACPPAPWAAGGVRLVQ